MKLRLFFLTVLSAFLFIGCSTDNYEEFFNDSSNSRLSDDNIASRQVTRPFKSKASGDWFINLNPQEYVCDGLLQYSIVGTGNATHMGKINILGTLCTFPPEGIYILEVTFTGANGDSITWRSGDDVFINEQGLYAGAVFDCVAGTGSFEDVSGQITVDDFLVPTEFDNTFEPPLPVVGTFSNMGLGTITY